MSYPLLIPTTKDRDKMLTFLKGEFKPWETLCEEQGHTSLIGKERFKGAYLTPKGKKGLRAEIPTEAYKYAFALMRWAALRVGKKKASPFLNTLGIQQEVPQYIYPNKKLVFPVLLVKKDSPLTKGRTRFYAVNPLGLPWTRIGPTETHKLKRKIIRGELKRLHNLWG